MNRFTRRRVIVLLVLTSVLLITFNNTSTGLIGNTRTAFGYVFRPFKGATRVVTRPVRNAWRGVTNYGELERDNLNLRDQLARQVGNAAAAEAFVQEHNELLKLQQLPISPSISTVIAQVIGTTPRGDQQTVEINQGTRRGVRVGMPVVNGSGLVGRVTEVFPDGAIVRLITDPQFVLSVRVTCASAIPGIIGPATTTTSTTTTIASPVITDPVAGATGADGTPSPGTTSTTSTVYNAFAPGSTVPIAGSGGTATRCDRETGSIRGRGRSELPLIGLLNDDAISRAILVGDQVVTSGGTDSLAPPNLPVGRVGRVVLRRGDSPIVEVKLNADLAHLNFVEVLLYLPVSEVGG